MKYKKHAHRDGRSEGWGGGGAAYQYFSSEVVPDSKMELTWTQAWIGPAALEILLILSLFTLSIPELPEYRTNWTFYSTVTGTEVRICPPDYSTFIDLAYAFILNLWCQVWVIISVYWSLFIGFLNITEFCYTIKQQVKLVFFPSFFALVSSVIYKLRYATQLNKVS